MKRFLGILMALVMTVSGLGAFAEEAAGTPMSMEELARTLSINGKAITTIITEPFYEGVHDAETAENAVMSVMDRLGADQSTQLMLDTTYSTEDLDYYVFRQVVGEVYVEGASAKVIVDKKGTAVCAVGSLKAGLDIRIPEEKEMTEEQAESLVAEAVKKSGASVQKGMSHEAVVEINGSTRLAWVVYTDNTEAELDVAYVAYYVSSEGEILGLAPIVTPYSTDEESSSFTELAFLGMEPAVWSGEVTLFDGSKRSLVVPIMKDAEGNEFLGDVQRKILCVDYSKWENEGNLDIRKSQNGRFDDGELLVYESIIRVWDFYQEIGWEGGDGKGTPLLLKMDLVDSEGNAIQNAYYQGKYKGFQGFAFNRIDRDGETLDVIGHEFTHCVTSTMSVNAPYRNDCGAINESLSDIMGNLIEEMMGASDDPTWLIGEAAKNPAQILRCMSDPHMYRQPAFIWDKYYYPNISDDADRFDHGGVHVNSSLLSLIAWRLHEAGMPADEEFDYMMNVILTMTGTITYPEMAVLLPWCLTQSKQDKYMDTLQAAIKETGIADIYPMGYPDGCAMIKAEIPENCPCSPATMAMSLLFTDENGETDSLMAWPDARLGVILRAVPAGKYSLQITDQESDRSWMLTENGWTDIAKLEGDEKPPMVILTFEEGILYRISLDTLTETGTETEAANAA